ncbi:hypothetical protein BH11PSE11_BH11PSE11_36720 [soil metagenome]
MSFLYPFMNFFQPGIFWPQLAPFMPMFVLSLLGLFVGFAKKPDFPRGQSFKHPVFIWLVIFVVIQPISLISGGPKDTMSGVTFWIVYLLFVTVSTLLISNQKALGRYVWGMMAGGIFIVMFGICAVLLGWKEAVGGRAGAYGMYENHNDYSFIIIQILPFLYMYRKATTGVVSKLFLGSALLACVVGILLSLSRGGMLAMVLEFGLIVMIGMEGRKRLFWLPILILIGAAAIGYQWSKRSENQGDSYTAADAENSRYELWRAAGNLIRANPILGVGSLRFSEYARFYGEISYDNRGKNTHNTYLEILTGTGFLGFIVFFTMIYQLLKGLHRRPQAHAPPLPLLDATRRATLIAMYSILFRALLDAKPHDWSFYALCSIGLACISLQRAAETAAANNEKIAAP